MIIETATKEELKSLTGLQRPFAIRNYLTGQRIPFMTGADGWPRVLRAIIMERLGGQITPPPAREPQLRLRNG